MVDGLLNFSLWEYVVATLVLTHVTIASVTIYLHRHQAHRGLDLHPAVAHFFRLWLWLTTGMTTKTWVAIHRKHHAKCETADDPHSPQVLGIRRVLWEGAELYRAEGANEETLKRYGHGTPDDWLERVVYTPHDRYGIAIMALIDLALFGVAGITVWAVQMMWIPFFAAGVINGLGHYWGYRNYEVEDASRNIVPWGILIGGEELHNNHHTYASSAKLSSRWWEFDIGWLYIRILQALRLARVKKVATALVIDRGKSAADMDTLKAVVGGRFQVMAHYSKSVLTRVYRDEIRRADMTCRALLKGARRLLAREESLMDEHARRRLASALSISSRLKTVYHFKQRLQDLWHRSADSNDSMLRALQEWCRQAEETGIRSLQDFARMLQGYSLRTAGA